MQRKLPKAPRGWRTVVRGRVAIWVPKNYPAMPSMIAGDREGVRRAEAAAEERRAREFAAVEGQLPSERFEALVRLVKGLTPGSERTRRALLNLLASSGLELEAAQRELDRAQRAARRRQA